MEKYVIETKGLTKKYGDKLAVNNVDMHVPQGSVYGFVGENGSGKTTIMRLLMGLAIPTKGQYALFGVDSKDRKIHEVRKHISAIVETPSLVPSLSAYDNLKYACLYYGISNYKEVIPEALKNVGLEDTGNKAAKHLSLGMRQRLGIAVLLLNKPTLMLLDEPMNGLDPSGVAELRDLIIELNKQGISFIVSSHILSELEKIATHYGFISHGKILKEISASDLALECQKYTDLKHNEPGKLKEALVALGYKEIKEFPNSVRIYDDVKPLELLKALEKKGIEVSDVKTSEMNVEDYYLNLIGGEKNV